jgi:hypothetical protein
VVKSAHGGIAALLPGEEFRGPVSVCRMDYEELGSSLPGFNSELTVNILYRVVNINATALRFCAVRYFNWLRG